MITPTPPAPLGSSPLIATTAYGTSAVHLVASGPDIAGTVPDRLPPMTLCGIQTKDLARGVGTGEINCERCLERSVQFMACPGWSTWR